MPLRRFFLKTRIFGPRVSPSTTPRIRALATNGAPGEHFAAVFFDEQDLVDAELGARLAGDAVDRR